MSTSSSSPANVMAPLFLPARLRIGCASEARDSAGRLPRRVLAARAARELLRLLRQQSVLERERLFPRTMPRPRREPVRGRRRGASPERLAVRAEGGAGRSAPRRPERLLPGPSAGRDGQRDAGRRRGGRRRDGHVHRACAGDSGPHRSGGVGHGYDRHVPGAAPAGGMGRAGAAGRADPAAARATYRPQPYLNLLALPLPPVASLSVNVLDSAGVPVPSALVYVRSTAMDWTLARSVVADGGVSTLSLREGGYQVQAAPPAGCSAPALSDAKSITLPQAAPLMLTCPPKVKRFGQVLGPDGRPVGANFQILATRLADGLVPTRTAFTTPTDGSGIFHLVADAGSWRFEIVPPAGTPLPRAIVGVVLDGTDLGESQMAPLLISNALHVGGTVRGRLSPGGADALVANAMVNFFSVDLNGHSVFLGGSRTDTQGHQDAYLPDVAQPGP